MAKTSNAGLVVAVLALTAATLNGWKRDRHEDAIHEHQNAEQNWQVYYSAPSRQALRTLLARTHHTPPKTNQLLRINRETNSCLHDYEARTRDFIAICVQNPSCDRSLRVHNPDGSMTLSANYGLDGLAPNSFIANYIPIRIRDIVASGDNSELSEENTRSIVDFLDSRVNQSVNTNQTALEACQGRLELVASSIAEQSHKQ